MVPFEEFVEQSQRAATGTDLRSLFERVMAGEGFENYFVGSLSEHVLESIAWVKFPEQHFENYLAERWYEVDPILTATARAIRPFCWDDVAASNQFSPRQVSLLDECKRMGVHSIIVMPFQRRNGGRDVVSISSRHAGPRDPRRLPVLHAVCAQTWWRYCELVGSRTVDEGEPPILTAKELEILRWIKHGKNNVDISEIMSLSPKTIEYHIGNIFKKLGASNRTAAVVLAIKNRLLGL